MTPSPRDDQQPVAKPEEWASLQALLSNCLKHPDAALKTAIEDGSLDADLAALTEAVGVDRPGPVPEVEDRDLTEDYEALFGALREPFAPPAASPYKEWFSDRDGGLMDGPPAARMEERMDALEVSIPDAYPPDHVAIQLEYASLLAETESMEELAVFVETEFDWIDALAARVTDAAAEAPFHRYCVDVLVTVLNRLRDGLGVSAPPSSDIEQMTNRAGSQRL